MTARPLLFSAPMVRALLAGRKTQTRRILKPQPSFDGAGTWGWNGRNGSFKGAQGAGVVDFAACAVKHGRYQVGDLLWARETWNIFAFSQDGESAWPLKAIPSHEEYREVIDEASRATWGIHYAASPINGHWTDEKRWRPSIHMPRWASRITLRVTEVRVQRLQDISEEDAIAEGYPPPEQRAKDGPDEIRDAYPIAWYAALWEEINGKDSWSANPWVVCLSFEVIAGNVDTVTGQQKDAAA